MSTPPRQLRLRGARHNGRYSPIGSSFGKRLHVELLEDRRMLATFAEFIDPNPNPGNQFGHAVVPLQSGNVVITSPFDDAGGDDAGAVYLFNGSSGALISTLTGSTALDRVGLDGVVVLKNSNFVVISSGWDNGIASDVGAVTFGDGTTGVSGAVSAANSLVGSSEDDSIGGSGVMVLANGNYIVKSSSWDNGGATDAGAVTFGNGTTGVSGTVSAANSLVGSTAGDQVGRFGVTELENGNYLVGSFFWDNGGATDAGAVTFGDGTIGVSGPVSAANSLVGSTAGDQVSGFGGVTELANGNYVVSSSEWNNGEATRAGAVTFGDGTTGVSGVVSAANSLVGSTAGDQVGRIGAVKALANGNYVVNSYFWDNGGATDAGAVTFGNGTTGVSGTVSAANSLVGSTESDRVGRGVTELENGNYLVGSFFWDNGGATDAGAVTFGDGTIGVSGPVSAANSLVGSTAGDQVGGVTELANGNYVVSSSRWDKRWSDQCRGGYLRQRNHGRRGHCERGQLPGRLHRW